jgi:hypothetical protein
MAIRWVGVYRNSRTRSRPLVVASHRGTVAILDRPGPVGPPERNFPLLVVIAHGAFAALTITLVLLTAWGVGGSRGPAAATTQVVSRPGCATWPVQAAHSGPAARGPRTPGRRLAGRALRAGGSRAAHPNDADGAGGRAPIHRGWAPIHRGWRPSTRTPEVANMPPFPSITLISASGTWAAASPRT